MAVSKKSQEPLPPAQTQTGPKLEVDLSSQVTTQLEMKDEPVKETLCIKSVSFIEAQEIRSRGQLGKLSKTMEWLKLEEGFGQGVFSNTPGVWIRNPPSSAITWANFVPIYSIAQISYELEERKQ